MFTYRCATSCLLLGLSVFFFFFSTVYENVMNPRAHKQSWFKCPSLVEKSSPVNNFLHNLVV